MPEGLSCEFIAGEGGCEDIWQFGSVCGGTPGKVKENCKKSCKNCGGKHVIISINM